MYKEPKRNPTINDKIVLVLFLNIFVIILENILIPTIAPNPKDDKIFNELGSSNLNFSTDVA